MIIIAEDLLLKASPDGEVLLHQVKTKLLATETQAMGKLAAILPKKEYEKIAEQILTFKQCHYPDSQSLLPVLSFKQRGQTAGTAHLQKWEIRLNPILLAENGTSFIDEVLPHEYAHLLVYALYGRVQPHGKEWQQMMEYVMNLPAKRTHQFDTTRSSTKQYRRFTYQCDCQIHQLTAIRHNRFQQGKAQYHCRQCGEILRPVVDSTTSQNFE